MTTYARLNGNIVAEIFTPPNGFSIADCFHSSLTWIECDSTPGVVAGWTATSGPGGWSFAAPAQPAPPTLSAQALAAFALGVTITSTSTPAVNGTYTIDGVAQGRIAAVSTYILVNSKFPGGMSTYPWLDIFGNPHVFVTTTLFQAFATAVADYVAALDMIAATDTGTLPPSSVTII